jgi:hypothetical protein
MRAKLILSLALNNSKAQVAGVVRVMHPEKGMGVEFNQTTDAHSTLVEDFLGTLSSGEIANPELLVEPEGIESTDPDDEQRWASKGVYDPLLDLFRRGLDLDVEEFHSELKKQRRPKSKSAAISI